MFLQLAACADPPAEAPRVVAPVPPAALPVAEAPAPVESVVVPPAPSGSSPAEERPVVPSAPLPTAAALPVGPYAELVAAIERDRQAFARVGAAEEARAYILLAIVDRIIPAWKGTPWAFYGTAEAPGGGEVACGYWVASVLRDVGFRVDRNHLGKQASERILLTVDPPERLLHFGSRPIEEVVARVRRLGEGIWGVGLANHAGLIWNDGTTVWFCHSNYHGYQGPMCEDAERSLALRTSYTVIASLLEPETVTAWLEGRTLPTGEFSPVP